MIELDGESYLDGREASTLLGIKISTLYTYVSRGVLKSYKQGIKRQRLYKQAELENLLQLRSSADILSSSGSEIEVPSQRSSELPPAEDWVPNI